MSIAVLPAAKSAGSAPTNFHAGNVKALTEAPLFKILIVLLPPNALLEVVNVVAASIDIVCSWSKEKFNAVVVTEVSCIIF